MIEDNDIKIFTLNMVGLSENACTILLEYFVMLYNGLTNTKDAYEDNGNVLGIVYDNETYFDKKLTIISSDSKSSGFDIANMTKKYKN